MSASAYGGGGRSLLEELSVVMVFQVGNPEGRSALAETFATIFDGVVVQAGRAARTAGRRKPPREIPACPFVVHAPRAGQRELDAGLRAERRGWWPMIVCREFRLSAEHPQAYRVRVMPLHEPVYKPDPLGLSDPYILGQCRAEAAHWGLTGLQKAVTEGMGPTPESVLRATAEAVQ